VKLVVSEPESTALKGHLDSGQRVATSRIALVEVQRAAAMAHPAAEARKRTDGLLASCTLVDVDDSLLRAAAEVASESVRTLNAIHLASAVRIEADEFLVYDRRLGAAAAELGLQVVSPD
jgi:uncharacterized protein